jgi:outer membrane receptor for monomeric catechols
VIEALYESGSKRPLYNVNIYLMPAKASIPTESVENVELISQPSSKYDASGSSGIINIQKKRIKEQGINLTISSGLERGKHT